MANESENKNTEVKNNEWKEREIGAVWVYDGKLKIKLNGKDGNPVYYICFPNKFKNNTSHPDWRVYTELGTKAPVVSSVTPPKTKITEVKPITKTKVKQPEPEGPPQDDGIENVPF